MVVVPGKLLSLNFKNQQEFSTEYNLSPLFEGTAYVHAMLL